MAANATQENNTLFCFRYTPHNEEGKTEAELIKPPRNARRINFRELFCFYEISFKTQYQVTNYLLACVHQMNS